MVIFAAAVPLPKSLTGSYGIDPAAARSLKPFARAVIVATMFHHVTTGYGAYQHWVKPSHHTAAMDIGVWGNVFLTLLGAAALLSGLNGDTSNGVKKRA